MLSLNMQVHEHFYGTLISHISKKLDTGIDIILDIDVRVFISFKKKILNINHIYIAAFIRYFERRLKMGNRLK